MAASSLSMGAEPGAASAEVDSCTLEINSKYDVTASVVCFVFFSLGFIYCFFGTYNATNAHKSQKAKFSGKTPVVSIVFTWWLKPAAEVLRRDKHKSRGSRWTILSEFDTGSINEAPPVAPERHFTSLNLT